MMYFHKVSSFLLMKLIFLIVLFSFVSCSSNKISRGKQVKDGDMIISSHRKFALGFFSPENSVLRYVGIWYHGIGAKTVVWIANREDPVSGNDGVLKITNDGNLVILNGKNNVLWSTNVSTAVRNATGILNDIGDLSLYGRNHRGRHGKQAYWQSFDYPTDTYLPETRVYLDRGEHRIITSWKTASDPSPGKYSTGFDSMGSPQIIIWEGSKRRWRSGHWNGVIFIGISGTREPYLYGFKIINKGDEKLYFIYTAPNSSDLVRFRLSWTGFEEQTTWKHDLNEWKLMLTHPEIQNECDLYNTCGPFATCDKNKIPICRCLFGFIPKELDQWLKGIWIDGCIRSTKLECNSSDGVEKEGFYHVDNVKLPDYVDYMGSEGIEECRVKCLKNCSCVAYSFVTGLNCMMWGNQYLIDIQNFVEDGSTLFFRIAQSELGRTGSNDVLKYILIAAALVIGVVFAMASIWQIQCRPKKIGSLDRNRTLSRDFFADLSGAREIGIEGQQGHGTELAYFSFSSIAEATDHFSLQNKLGHGGFGLVYKGRLPGGGEIAVKRLCRMSGQGLEEFKNEIMLIARLQHRNLVRLLGCCLEGVEKILLYEYMPNKSLDSFIFVPQKKTLLDWRKRLHIIEGVARGLLYLHRDSRLRIIHRDLKASNILLDEDMNPKISDFGMARIFGGNQNEANTVRVVGTYGYMSPEYAMEGVFSVKSDVYSFGVLLLEIISGRRNTSFRTDDYSSIIGHVWELWESDKAIELLDPTIADTSDPESVLKCVNIGMLCVQDLAVHRPTMSAIVLMLESDNAVLPQPKKPALTTIRSEDIEMWDAKQNVITSNDVTITTIVGR